MPENAEKKKSALKIYVQEIVPMADLLVGTIADTATSLTPNVGDVVRGSVVTIDKGRIIVDLGNVATGVISGQEVSDNTRTAEGLKAGDEIEAVVIDSENDEGQFVLSLRRASQEKAWQVYQDAYEKGEPLTVEIGEANKGGLLMEIDGIRGFIPVSQLTPEHYPRVAGADPEKILARLAKLVGEQITVKILSLDPVERRMILSEKAAYLKEREAILKTLTVGETIKGRVSGIVNFGIFVNYKGVEGLVHISEIAWGHVSDPSQHATVGDDVEVKIIGLEGDKVSFSIKRLTPDPWIEAVSKFKEGDVIDGVVARFTPFGAFVRITPEVDGLIHNSELGFGEGVDASSALTQDQQVRAKIISIDRDEHRVGLSLKNVDGTAEDAPAPKKKSTKKAAASDEEDEAPKKKTTKAKRVKIADDEDDLP